MSMEKLKLAIGPAPNEIPYADLISNLMRERERINQVLFSAKSVKKVVKKVTAERKPRKKKTITSQQAEDILRRLTL
jgi:hypothetical protein